MTDSYIDENVWRKNLDDSGTDLEWRAGVGIGRALFAKVWRGVRPKKGDANELQTPGGGVC